MPAIYPFSAWRYNPRRITDLATVVSPPYDVVSASDREKLGKRSPYHFAHIILPDGPEAEKYHRAAAYLDRWIDENILNWDEHPAIYILEQTFDIQDQTYRRTGIVCEIALEPMGTGILPHEETIPKHVTDRFRLMTATRANTGQIFMSYQDDSRAVETLHAACRSEPPEMDFTLDDVRYRVWAIRSASNIHHLQTVLGRTPAIIADGHHRYQTALRYFREHPDIKGSDRVMVTLVNANDPGMQVLPTHRIINSDLAPQIVIERLRTVMPVEPVSDISEATAFLKHDATRVGLVYGPSQQAWVLTPKPSSDDLDVTIFHHTVLPQGFQLDTTTPEGLAHISYLRGTSDPMDFIRQGDFTWLGLIRPPSLSQVFEMAGRRRTMPQKSTYFFPKVYSGFLFRRF